MAEQAPRRYEYRYDWEHTNDPNEIQYLLDSWAEKGWEIVSHSEHPGQISLVFRREVPREVAE